jgi:hypothetical protein
MRWLSLSLWLIASIAALPDSARADPPRAPADVSLEQFEASALPEAPSGFVSRRIGEVRWDHPSSTGDLVDELAATLVAEWPRLERELGTAVDDRLTIRIARSPDEMSRLAPARAPPPAYAVGVAYPASGLILLTLSAPDTWERPDLEHVLVHELSHVALHRAAGGREIPRWLSEGVAIHQARERSFERVQTLWNATVRGTLIPLDDLSRSFPSRPHRVGIAYAESADFVEWLRRRGEGGDQFAELVARIARGESFETAVSQTWSADIGQLEHEWRQGLSERYGFLPLLFGTGAIWAMISVLLVIAWLRRKRDARVRLRQWEREEAEIRQTAARARAIAELQAEALGGATLATAVTSSAPAAAAPRAGAADESRPAGADPDAPEDDAVVDDGRPRIAAIAIPDDRDPHVPTIQWEGRNHTLH